MLNFKIIFGYLCRYKTTFQKLLMLRSAIIIFCFSSIILQGQDPIYSQFFMTPMHINPAFAGVNYSPTIASNYRLQWPGITTTYSTFSLSYDQFFESSNLALGAHILSDAAGEGALNTTKASGILGYRLPINRSTFIRGGIELSYVQRRLNWEKFVFYDGLVANNGAYTPGGSSIPSSEIAPGNLRRGYLDISSGLLLYNSNYFIGISFDHMNTPVDEFLQNDEQNYIGLPIRLTVNGGYQMNIGRPSRDNLQNYFTPSILYVKQGSFQQLNFGGYFGLSQLFGGLFYRLGGGNSDALIINFGIRSNNWKIGYSFDLTTSGISLSGSGGSHEIGMNYIFGDGEPKYKLNDCLNLFR